MSELANTPMQFKYIPLEKISVPDIQMRKVNVDAEPFQKLCDSIKETGILQPVQVRPSTEKKGEYTLVFGFHRTKAAQVLGLQTIPCTILDVPNDEIAYRQVIENVQRVNAKPVEIARSLQKILAMPENQFLSREEFTRKLGLGKSVSWINSMLNLTDIIPEAEQLLSENKLNISNARLLAQLPADEQLNWVERACTTPPNEFVTLVANRKAELKQVAKGGAPKPADPLKAAVMAKMTAIKGWFKELEEQLSTVSDPIAKANIQGQYLAYQKVMQIDPDTVKRKESERLAKEAVKNKFLEERKKHMQEAMDAAKKQWEQKEAELTKASA